MYRLFPLLLLVAISISCTTYPPLPKWVKQPKTHASIKGQIYANTSAKYTEDSISAATRSEAAGREQIAEKVKEWVGSWLKNFVIQLGDLSERNAIVPKLEQSDLAPRLEKSIVKLIKKLDSFKDEKTKTYHILTGLEIDSLVFKFREVVADIVRRAKGLSTFNKDKTLKLLDKFLTKEKKKVLRRHK